MSEQITVLFTNIRQFSGQNVDGEYEFWCPERGKEYCVTLERVDEGLVYLTLPNGFRMSLLPPGFSTNYTVVREGWRADQGIATLVKQPGMRPPSTPILESALILEIRPFELDDRLAFRLPRIINGILVDRGYCSQEVTYGVDDCPVGDELCGKASFMLKNHGHGAFRYFCTSFRVDNVTSKKNLTTQHGRGSLPTV